MARDPAYRNKVLLLLLVAAVPGCLWHLACRPIRSALF
jgi:hypothetical protein